jgi:hypothetical protein
MTMLGVYNHPKFKNGPRISRYSVYASLTCLVFIFLVSSCIYPYRPEIDEEIELLTIEGSLIKGSEEQTVTVSSTTSLIYPQFFPVRGCKVAVIDNLDNKFEYQQNLNGTYSLEIPDDQLIFQRQYKLQVITPRGKIYESEYEELNSGADVDTVYFEQKRSFDKSTGELLQGIQFYIDLKASDTISRYYRWKLNETFEFTSISPITFIIRPDSNLYLDNQYEFFRCWKTADIKELFLSNTVNLSLNEKKKIDLNYVSNETDRLKYKYSLFVEQYTLSESAYEYWQKKKIATQESGGLYTQQPGKPITNIHNIEDPDELILGFFWCSHKTEHRIFVPRIPSLQIEGESCDLVPFDPKIHKGIRYIYVDEDTGVEMTSISFCMNCLLKNAPNKPPDFWE